MEAVIAAVTDGDVREFSTDWFSTHTSMVTGWPISMLFGLQATKSLQMVGAASRLAVHTF
mgnify:CR=1 FL=1